MALPLAILKLLFQVFRVPSIASLFLGFVLWRSFRLHSYPFLGMPDFYSGYIDFFPMSRKHRVGNT